ncbi:MAG: hypothetical protein JF609_10675, partial [Verrucomicrobia bacterium]|nr:hypothetical protein [Verrucomicrobiota bacterium]
MKILGQVVILLALSGAIGSAQTYSIIYNFTNYSGGLEPKTGLTFNNNVLYGTTSYGGSGGTLFKINPDGSGYLALSSPGGYAFNAGLTMNGSTLYAASGSAIFKVNVDIGNYVDLLSYTGSPLSAFVLNGTNLLATSNQGGSAGWGSIFRINTDGTMSARLYSFSNSPDGARPLAGLVLDGNTLYGTTSSGGNANGGVVFKINLDGTGYTILHHFASYPDGSSPQGDLVLDGNTLYGTTQY